MHGSDRAIIRDFTAILTLVPVYTHVDNTHMVAVSSLISVCGIIDLDSFSVVAFIKIYMRLLIIIIEYSPNISNKFVYIIYSL